MDFLAQALLPYILLYKYWALFGVTFLAAFALPIPAGTLLITSSAFASQGYFKLGSLLAVVLVANILGDSLSYFISRYYGRKLFCHFKFMQKILDSKNFNLVQKGINRRPGFLIILSRFEVISTLTLNFICGLSKVPYRKFLLFEIIGTFCNVFFYTIIGYSFASSWQAINKLIGDFTIIFFLVIALLISLFWKRIIYKLNQMSSI